MAPRKTKDQEEAGPETPETGEPQVDEAAKQDWLRDCRLCILYSNLLATFAFMYVASIALKPSETKR